jgi:hypothetical protein
VNNQGTTQLSLFTVRTEPILLKAGDAIGYVVVRSAAQSWFATIDKLLAKMLQAAALRLSTLLSTINLAIYLDSATASLP